MTILSKLQACYHRMISNEPAGRLLSLVCTLNAPTDAAEIIINDAASIREVHPVPWNNLCSARVQRERVRRRPVETHHLVQLRLLALWLHAAHLL